MTLFSENAATWHSYCRWNAERKLFSAILYSRGNRFVDGVRYLEDDVFAELDGARRAENSFCEESGTRSHGQHNIDSLTVCGRPVVCLWPP